MYSDINERKHGAASKLRDGEGSCGAYWYRSSPATCPHHRSDYFLPEAHVTKEKNKSVQFKRTARTNENTARLLGFETERDHAVRIGTVPHLPPALTTDLIISYLKLVRQKRKTSQFSSNVQRERTQTWHGFGHGTASRLRDGEGSCGEYWGRSSPTSPQI